MDVHAGWMRALQNAGHTVASLNLGDRIDFYHSAHVKKGRRWVKAFADLEAVKLASKGVEASVFEFMPDIVFLTSGFFVPTDTLNLLRSRGVKVVLMHTESPYEDDVQISRAEHADLNLVNDPTNLDRFPANSVYQWHCYDPAVHRPREPRPECASDFCFVGTAYPSRIAFLEQVDWTDIDVALAGNWRRIDPQSPLVKFVAHDLAECVDNTDAVDLYAATKVSANLYRKEAQRAELSEGWAMGPREVELAACGIPFLREPRGEGDEILSMLPTFTTPDEFGLRLRELLADETRRLAVAGAARDAIADRTFANAATRLLDLL
jgi:spore maturation protein CgeB